MATVSRASTTLPPTAVTDQGPEGKAPQAVPGLVSVIMIFRNEARFLQEAIDSVRTQSYSHWELLLVDDGSGDESPAIAARVAGEDPVRVHCLRHPEGANRGMSASRNLGLAAARGEYVAFLDGDDVYLPQRLERHVAILSAFPRISVVQSHHVRWRSWLPHALAEDETRPFLAVGDQVFWPPLGVHRMLAVPSLAAGICNVTVRRSAAIAAGGFVDAFTSLYEDQVFVTRLMLREPVYVLQDYLALYRYHGHSATRRVADAGRAERDRYSRAYYDWVIGFLQEQGVDRDSDLLRLAQEQRAALDPSPGRRRRQAAFRLAREGLQRLLPLSWYERLLRLDYERDNRARARADRALAEGLTRRARDALAFSGRTDEPA